MANMFLALTNIPGESLDAAHTGEIEIHDWEWGMHNKASFQLTGNKAAQHTKISHLTIHKKFDKSTPTLMLHCAQGKKIDKGTLTCRKNDGENKVEYLTIELHEIKVNELKWPIKGGDDSAGFVETLELSFHTVQVVYKVQIRDGSLAGATEFPLYNIADPDDVT